MLERIFNPSPTFYKWDKFWVGFIPGLFGPVLCIVFFYVFKFSDYTPVEYFGMIKHPTVLSPMLSLGVIINLFIFFPFIWNDYYNAARGVIGATFIYGIPILVTKFLM